MCICCQLTDVLNHFVTIRKSVVIAKNLTMLISGSLEMCEILNVLASKTIHGVDEERIIFMQARFEKIFNYDSMYASNRNQQKSIPLIAQSSAFPSVGAAATNVSTYHSSSPLNIPIIPPGTSSFPAKTPIRVNEGASSSNAFLRGGQKSSTDQALESVLSAAFGTANNVPTGTKPKAPVG